jgi:5-methylcytosine-specific restriction endonuclease McrA
VVVDHINNRKQFPHLALELSNLCVVHHACNTKKYYDLEANAREAVGIDGFPEAWR